MTLAIDREIEVLQAKKEWIVRGMEMAVEAGYDRDYYSLESAVTTAYKTASFEHAVYMGDGAYKPIDYDCNFPQDEDSFKSFVLSECHKEGVGLHFDVTKELQKIDPNFAGEGTLKEIFAVVGEAVGKQDPDLNLRVSQFRRAAYVHHRPEIRALARAVDDAKTYTPAPQAA